MPRVLGVGAALLAAAAGVVWYAVAPGVGSFQASGLLTAPALILGLIWLHRRIPVWLQWGLAVSLAPIGPVAYLVWGGDQWWNWGQLTPLPLLLLLFGDEIRAAFSDEDDDERASHSPYGGFADGPWGPP